MKQYRIKTPQERRQRAETIFAVVLIGLIIASVIVNFYFLG